MPNSSVVSDSAEAMTVGSIRAKWSLLHRANPLFDLLRLHSNPR